MEGTLLFTGKSMSDHEEGGSGLISRGGRKSGLIRR